MEPLITLKVLPESRQALKILAAQQRTTMILLFEKLIQDAFKKEQESK